MPGDLQVPFSDVSTVETIGMRRPSRPRVLALTLLAHPDWRRVGERRKLTGDGSAVALEISRLEPVFERGLPLADPSLSRQPCLRVAARADGSATLDRLTEARIVVDGEPLDSHLSIDPDELDSGLTLVLGGRIALLLHRVELFAPRPQSRHGLLGESDVLLRLACEIDKAAPLDSAVLLRGASGTGKELVARALHQGSRRAEGPYVAVNLAAVPAELAAAELFGVEKGSFTGADRRRLGFFRQAEGGTLFLDEVGSAPLPVQDLLLRALENKQIQPIGHERTLPVDVRVIAATDLDLEAAVADGRFRAPLLHRLRAWEIRLPHLHERRDDIARLLHFFLAEELATLGAGDRAADPGPKGVPWLPAELVAELVAESWPGNVRELRNVARHLAVGSFENQVAELSLKAAPKVPETQPGPAPVAEATPRVYRRPDSIEQDELIAALRQNRWHVRDTAEALGISRTSLYSLMEKCPAVRKASDLDKETLLRLLAEQGPHPDLRKVAAELEISYRGLMLRLGELGLAAKET